MRVRKVEKEDIKVGAIIIDNKGKSWKIKSIQGEYIHFTERTYYSTIREVLSGFTVNNDKTTGIPAFDGSVREEHVSINQCSSENAQSKDRQIGGYHYNKNDPIQFARDNYPAEQLEGFLRINVDKYVARYDKKNGLEDLKKARHYLDMLIELKEYQNAE